MIVTIHVSMSLSWRTDSIGKEAKEGAEFRKREGNGQKAQRERRKPSPLKKTAKRKKKVESGRAVDKISRSSEMSSFKTREGTIRANRDQFTC